MSSLLEQLPFDAYALMCEYISLVDYGDDAEARTPGKKAPYILQVRLARRGYALAACSKACHQLTNQVAEQFYRRCADSVVPDPVQFNCDNDEREKALAAAHLSFLQRWYILKDAECVFRSNLRSLEDSLKTFESGSDIGLENERMLVEKAERIVDRPIGRYAWPEAQIACEKACCFALRVRKKSERGVVIRSVRKHCLDPTLRTRPDVGVAKRVQRVLGKLYEMLASSALPNRWSYINVVRMSVLQLQSLAYSEPNPFNHLHASAANTCREKALSLVLEEEFKELGWMQTDRINMYTSLIDHYRREGRTEDSFAAVERARDDTQDLDPINLHTLANVVRTHASEYGLDRSIEFVREAELKFREASSDDFLWRTPSSSSTTKLRTLEKYRGSCSSWLKSMENRQE